MLESFLRAGANYLTNAEWGCMAGVHAAWILVEAGSEAEARLMVPPAIRNTALLVKISRFTPEQIKAMASQGQA
jgi:hypothetical protein